MNVPSHLKYAESHEWLDESTGAVGITEHAQAELSDVVYVELPAVGRQVKAGEAVAVVESVKAASDIYAPVGGEVAEVNSALTDNPGFVNSSPYQDGWIFKLKIANASEVSKLKDAAGYEALLG